MGILRYFGWAILFTFIGIAASAWLGWLETQTLSSVYSYVFICSVLAILEISLSFDNSIVNARILNEMQPKWQDRFLTWGIIIAVFGMRIIFPLLVVAIAAWINPIAALKLAIWQPQLYAKTISDAHVAIAAFGGTFLLMVAIKFFFDSDKSVHWIAAIEKPAQKLASIHYLDIVIVLIVIVIFTIPIKQTAEYTFLLAAVFGLITFIAIEALGTILDYEKPLLQDAVKGGLGAFIYLEVLDASFSFDGVIGAFALSTNLFIIAIGLGIGAFYVRSMTILLVEKGTLAQYRYLEHGAFYAILILALIMFLQTFSHIPEYITGLIGVAFIVFSFVSSLVYNRKYRK